MILDLVFIFAFIIIPYICATRVSEISLLDEDGNVENTCSISIWNNNNKMNTKFKIICGPIRFKTLIFLSLNRQRYIYIYI